MRKKLSMTLAMSLLAAGRPGLVGRDDTLALVDTTRQGTAAAFIKPDGSLWLWGHSANPYEWGMNTHDLFVPARFPDTAVKLPSVSAAVSGQ